MDSKIVATMGEVKHVVVNVVADSRISIVISLIIVDMPPTYVMLLGREWIHSTGASINTWMETITFPHNKDLIILPQEGKHKEKIQPRESQEAHIHYISNDMGIYTIPGDLEYGLPTTEEKNYHAQALNSEKIWLMHFDGANSKCGSRDRDSLTVTEWCNSHFLIQTWFFMY